MIVDLQKSVVILEGGTSREPKIFHAKMDNMKAIIEHCHG